MLLSLASLFLVALQAPVVGQRLNGPLTAPNGSRCVRHLPLRAAPIGGGVPPRPLHSWPWPNPIRSDDGFGPLERTPLSGSRARFRPFLGTIRRRRDT